MDAAGMESAKAGLDALVEELKTAELSKVRESMRSPAARRLNLHVILGLTIVLVLKLIKLWLTLIVWTFVTTRAFSSSSTPYLSV